MGKIYSSSKHSHQDGKILYKGKGPQRLHKIQKRQNTPQDSQCAHSKKTSERDTNVDLESRNPPHILEGEVKHEINFSGKYYEYCNRCKETRCWCFTSDWEEGLNANNPNSSVEILLSPTAKKPPAGWSKSRCRVIKKTDTTGPPSPREEMSTDSGTSIH